MSLPNSPTTRKETYLAKIAGQNTTLPEYPTTREEDYLDYIAKHGGGGGGGTDDYDQLENRPQFNGTTWTGNKTTEDMIPIGNGLSINEDGELEATGGGGTFEGLADVNISNPGNGQYIKYDTTSQKYIKGFKRTVLSATLAAGSTSVTFTDSAITNTALYRVFTDPFVEYDDITQSGTTITITFTAQESAVGIKLVIEEE